MHLGPKIFGVRYALFLAYGVEANGKRFEQRFLLVLVWVGAVYSQFPVHLVNFVWRNNSLQFTWDRYGFLIVL